MTYTIVNKYGVNIGDHKKYRNPLRALKALDRYTGSGWVVIDASGKQITYGGWDNDCAMYCDSGLIIKNSK